MRKLKRVKTILTTTAIVTIGVFSMFLAQADAKTFKDVKSSHWAYKSIDLVSNQNIIEGYPDGTFKPNNNVTRAEFAAMLARTIKGDEKGSHSFSDVPQGHWASEIIGQGVAQGFIDPKDYNGKFEPNKALTRAEMAKWMANGLAMKNSEYKQAIEDTKDTLLPIPEYYRGLKKADVPYIAVAMGTGLLNGYPDDTFRPNGNTTRAEVATLITRFQNVMAKQPDQFLHLREFRAVGTTGTNVEEVTNFEVYRMPFSNVRGKDIPHTRGVGVAKINRLIFIDGGTPSTSKSAYAKMFTTEEDAKWHTGKSYPVFVEKTFTVTAPVDKTFTDKYNNNNLNTLLYGFQLNADARKKFNIPGYGNGGNGIRQVDFFKELKPNELYWEATSADKDAMFVSIDIDSDENNRFFARKKNN